MQNNVRLYNTMSRKVEEITQINDTFGLYTCGFTVYNSPHVGNWVMFIRYDMLVRMLRANGFTVVHVENVTDVGHLTSDADEGEDKMQKGAKREGISAWDVAERYTNEMLEGSRALNITPPNYLTKATDHITEQIELIKKLEAKGFTYIIDDGVYFDTGKLGNYGELARLDLESLKAGARVEMNEQKRNHTDFALWKFSPKNEQRDMEWPSPWGVGFPGWHLECSAMAIKYLGETIDMHAGGIDHIPVHHVNEIAQSEAATGKQFARYWVHGHFLLSGGQKIAKSLGNGYTLAQIAERGFAPLDLRMLTLQSHYRSDANFTWEALEAARNRRLNLQAIADLRFQTIAEREPVGPELLNDTLLTVNTALTNDLNSPQALAALSKLEDTLATRLIHTNELTDFKKFLEQVDELLGLQLTASKDITDAQKQLITERETARTNKDYARADQIRDELKEQHIELRDTPYGSVWFRNDDN